MLALEGIRVLELARTPIASLGAMMLGDFGADVLRVESPPRAGADAHSLPGGKRGEREALHQCLHRNKRSLGLNLASAEGREVFLRLAKNADVVIEGFRPGVVTRLGVDYETIDKINPRIVYCSISGYGQDGPYREMPGHDINYISVAGALGMMGNPGGPPMIPANLVADWGGGAMHATVGILLALVARGTTGRGQHVDTSMTDSVVALMGSLASGYFLDGVVPRQGGNFLVGAFPYYNVYKAKDGRYIAIGCVEPWLWENLCRELRREDLIPYQFTPEHRTMKPEGGHWELAFAALKKIFLTKTSDEWFMLLGHKNIPITKVNYLDEVFRDPQVLHRKMVVELAHPTHGNIRQVGIAIKLSDTPGVIRSFPPQPGEHTDEVLREEGYAAKDVERLRENRVVF